MKAMVCEICGSNDLVKKDGVYVCESCGTKYSVEEARKLVGIVKVDKTEETEKLLILARRAREDDNSENAEKYYGMVLQEDPSNWEAAFFQVYYKAMQCKIIDIANAGYSVANNIDTTIRLISDLPDEDERKQAINTVITYCHIISDMLSSAAINHYNKFSTATNAYSECSHRVAVTHMIYDMLEKSLKKYFPTDNKIISIVQVMSNSFISDNGRFFNAEYRASETKRLTEEIQSKDNSYTPPTVQTGGCYIATATYGSYDCPEVWTLRRYRDTILAKTWYGRTFVQIYYKCSPSLVKYCGDSKLFKSISRSVLDKIVHNLNSEGIADTPYNDKKELVSNEPDR